MLDNRTVSSPPLPGVLPPFTELEAAVLRTLLYADIFDYPLTAAEAHHFLIETQAALPEVQTALATLSADGWVERLGGYYALAGRAELALLRQSRQRHSTELKQKMRWWGYWLGCLPFVRMAAVTGALAMANAPEGDDIDLLIVTAPGRVWLARAAVVALVYAARPFGVRLCPNYVLAQSSLAQTQRDLYIAHELAQMAPLVGRAVYHAMRAANGWLRDYLPQADEPRWSEAEQLPRGLGRLFQQVSEWMLSGRFGDALEAWEYRRKQRKFACAAQTSAAAQLDAEHVKGHFNDHGQWVRAAYEARLARYGLENPSIDYMDFTENHFVSA